MVDVRTRRDRERGNAMLVAMIVLTGLGLLSSLTVISVQGGASTTSNDRFHAIAVYAAESGGAAAIDYLRTNINPTQGFTEWVDQPIESPSDIPGNNVPPGGTGNPFSDDINAWYRVEVMNNRNDPMYTSNIDSDRRVVLRITGHGPNGAVAVLEWDVATGIDAAQRPCTGYAQENMSEDNSGLNECLGSINSADTAKLTQ
jgi:hypothetical protein